MTAVEAPAFFTLDDLNEVLRPHGFNVNHVERTGMRFDVATGSGGERALVLVVTLFSLNEQGKRYIGDDRKVATEVRRFFVGGFGPIMPCTWPVEETEPVAE